MSAPSNSRYELIELIGEGGMGRVYRAVHHPSARTVAVKRLRHEVRDDPTRRRLLLDEATAAARLYDPGIVELLDVGADAEGAPFLVFELVEGHDLDAWVSAWPGFARVAVALDDVLRGLAAAHAAGIVHRDLKPSNILVTPDGHAKIADFGIARLFDPLRKHEERGVLGTPEYMAPEQIRSSDPLGPWTDLYAVGAVLYHLVTGHLPFEGNVPAITVAKLIGAAPTPVPRRGLELPPDGIALIRALLESSPRRRPRFAEDVRRALADVATRVIDHATSPVPTTPPASRSLGVAATFDSRPSVERIEVEVDAPTLSSDPAIGAPAFDTLRSVPPIAELPTSLRASGALGPGASLIHLRELPLVARETERARLRALIDDVCREGAPRAVAFVGTAGVGKSRLARSGLAEVERHGLMEGVAVGYDLTGTVLTGGLRNALLRVLGAPEDPISGFAWLADGRVDLEALAAWLKPKGGATLSPEACIALSHATLRALGRRRPVYLWLDDGGWSSDGALELVMRLLDDPQARTLAVVTLRAGTAEHPRVRGWLDALRAHPRGEVCEVGPFERDDRVRLLEAIAPFAPGVAAQIASAVDGTPLQMLHLVRAWLERGLLEPSKEGMTPRESLSVEALVAERPLEVLVGDRVRTLVDAMGARSGSAERVLLRAALLGVRFEVEALRFACEGDEPSTECVDDVLDRALLLGIVRFESGHLYEFEHPLLQEHLLSRLGSSLEHAPLIRTTVAAIWARYGRTRADVGARAITLLRQAGDRDAAWKLFVETVAMFSRESAIERALELVREADRWVVEDAEPHVSQRHLAVRMAQTTVLYWGLRYDEALVPLAIARDIANQLGDRLAIVRCMQKEASIWLYKEQYARARALARAVVETPATADDAYEYTRSACCELLMQLACLEGDFDTAERGSAEYIACSSKLGGWMMWHALLGSVVLSIALERVEEALGKHERLVAGVRAANDVDFLADLQVMAVLIELLRGRPLRARETLAEPLRRAAAAGDRWRLSELLAADACMAAELDPPDDRAAAVARFLAAFGDVPNDTLIAHVWMGRLIRRLDELGDADLAESVRLCQETRRQVYVSGFGSS